MLEAGLSGTRIKCQIAPTFNVFLKIGQIK